MKYIRLTGIRKQGCRVDFDFAVSPELETYFAPAHTLFFQYGFPLDEVPDSILTVPFLSCVMQTAWLTDAEVYVPAVDSTFAASLDRLRKAYQMMYPRCPLGGSLKADTVVDTPIRPGSGVAQLYTGGLDAVTTFIRHHEETPTLIQEYGFYDLSKIADGFAGDEKSNRNFLSDQKAANEFAAIHGLKTCFIWSNFGTFIRMNAIDPVYYNLLGDLYWHGLHHAMALLGAAVPFAWENGIRTLYIASSFSVGNTYPCASDPTTDNEFRVSGLTVVHDGYEMTDQDKARTTVAYQRASGKLLPLRVCSWNDHNCCHCEKCCRRMLQLNAEGGNPADFGFFYEGTLAEQVKRYLYDEIQFFTPKNIDKWGRIIRRSAENIDNVYDREIVTFLESYDFAKEKKRGLPRYYARNFFHILSRKLKGLFGRG